MRLDQYLVEHGLAPSRARAQELVRAGHVWVNGAASTKTARKISRGDEVLLSGAAHDYVSRGALKLLRGLELISQSPAGKICLDLGASTGGFTQVLLRGGARKVYAVDVGHGQLHQAVASDRRVVNLEKTHAKELSGDVVSEAVALIVCDVSFISLMKALPFALALAAPDAECVALIKPQFELGPEYIGKGGLVKASDADLAALCQRVTGWFEAQGWQVTQIADSPIEGGDGNKEFLIGAFKRA